MGNNSSCFKISCKSNKRSSSSISITKIVNEEEINGSDNEENDHIHIDRQHNYYFFKKHIFQSECSSPIKEMLTRGCKVLDIGCGVATFLLDFASQYSNSEFVGVDIKSDFPNEIKPKNLNFIMADVLQGLPFGDNEFDFVNIDSVLFAFSISKVNFIINEMIRVAKPNGYLEFGESMATKIVGEKFGCLMHGYKFISDIVSTLPELLTTNSDLKNIQSEDRIIVIGKDGDKLGDILLKNLYIWYNRSTEHFVNDSCRILNITKEGYDQLVEDSFKELRYISPEFTFFRIYAQKK